MPRSTEVIYDERHGSMRWVYGALLFDAFNLLMIFVFTDDPFVDVVARAWPLIPLLMFLALPFIAVSIGKRVFGNVRVTRRHLRVGRHVWLVSDLDREFLKEQRAQPDADIVEQWTRTMARVDVPSQGRGRRRPDFAKPKVLGGGYGLPAGADEMLLLRRDGSVWTMATKNRTALLDALIRVVPA